MESPKTTFGQIVYSLRNCKSTVQMRYNDICLPRKYDDTFSMANVVEICFNPFSDILVLDDESEETFRDASFWESLQGSLTRQMSTVMKVAHVMKFRICFSICFDDMFGSGETVKGIGFDMADMNEYHRKLSDLLSRNMYAEKILFLEIWNNMVLPHQLPMYRKDRLCPVGIVLNGHCGCSPIDRVVANEYLPCIKTHFADIQYLFITADDFMTAGNFSAIDDTLRSLSELERLKYFETDFKQIFMRDIRKMYPLGAPELLLKESLNTVYTIDEDETISSMMTIAEGDMQIEMCCVCWEKPSCILFPSCYHMITCKDCGLNDILRTCPMCRQHIWTRHVIESPPEA